jgi:asparagine synthase (glutamine-hydrolysing)
MSGIYGIFQHQGAAEPGQSERMRSAMAFWGPDGGGSGTAGPVVLGHLLLRIHPEDAFEEQPMSGERFFAVAAARLDNREELREALGLSASEMRTAADGRLVSLALERWGEEVSAHLRGDWSLAAWDRQRQRLLVARDATGNSPLYYYAGKEYFAFASSLKALLALPGVGKTADRMRLAQVLVAWQPDGERTAYEEFKRLPWAHEMTVDRDGRIAVRRHWSPLGRALLRYRRDEEYAEAFLEVYERAVRSSLRTEMPVAATLSGGRDSGSVVALAGLQLAARGRGLTAFTSVPCLPADGAEDRMLGNEWELAHATAALSGPAVEHVAVDAREYSVLQGMEHLLDCHDGPGHAAGNLYWLLAIHEAAARKGVGVLLTGQMGNAAVSWAGNGSALLALRQGSPATAFRLLFQGEPSGWLNLKRQVLRPLLLPGMEALRRVRGGPGASWRDYSALNREMGAQLDLDGRMRAAGFDPSFTIRPWQDAHPRFFWPVFGIGYSIGVEMATRHRVATIDPTANLSLIEFILRVPDDQFRHRGQNNWLFRRAFRGRLPEEVLSGRRKGLQAADLGHRVVRELAAFRACLSALDGLAEAREMLDLPLLHRCLEDLVARVDASSSRRAVTILLRGMGVGLFLLRLKSSCSRTEP